MQSASIKGEIQYYQSPTKRSSQCDFPSLNSNSKDLRCFLARGAPNFDRLTHLSNSSLGASSRRAPNCQLPSASASAGTASIRTMHARKDLCLTADREGLGQCAKSFPTLSSSVGCDSRYVCASLSGWATEAVLQLRKRAHPDSLAEYLCHP